MIEIYPQTIDQDKLKANLDKLVSAFLMAAEDIVNENELPATLTKIEKTLVNL